MFIPPLTDAAYVVMWSRVYETVLCPSVSQTAAAGWYGSAGVAGDID